MGQVYYSVSLDESGDVRGVLPRGGGVAGRVGK